MSFEPDSSNRDKKARPDHVRVSSQVCAVHGPSLFPAYSSQLIAYSCLEEAYETYGQATIYNWLPGDFDRDADVDTDDEDVLLAVALQEQSASYTAYPYLDLNLDGVVTDHPLTGDLAWMERVWTAPPVMTSSPLGNPFLFTGRTTDTLHAGDLLASNDPQFHRLQDNRNRIYLVKHGRWLQRDPLGMALISWAGRNGIGTNSSPEAGAQYSDGMNLYEYVGSQPSRQYDPLGLFKCERVVAVNPAATPNFMYLSPWKLYLAYTTGIGAGSGSVFGGSVAEKWTSLWMIQYTELFKCCPNGDGKDKAPQYLWGGVSYAGTWVSDKVNTANSWQVFHISGGFKISGPRGVTVATGVYKCCTKKDEAALKKVALGGKVAATPAVEWGMPLTPPSGCTKIVDHIKCGQTGGTWPYPGTAPANAPPLPGIGKGDITD